MTPFTEHYIEAAFRLMSMSWIDLREITPFVLWKEAVAANMSHYFDEEFEDFQFFMERGEAFYTRVMALAGERLNAGIDTHSNTESASV